MVPSTYRGSNMPGIDFQAVRQAARMQDVLDLLHFAPMASRGDEQVRIQGEPTGPLGQRPWDQPSRRGSQSLRTSQRRSPLDSSLVTGQRLPKRPVREEEPVLSRTQEFPLPPEFPPIILIGGPSIIVIALTCTLCIARFSFLNVTSAKPAQRLSR